MTRDPDQPSGVSADDEWVARVRTDFPYRQGRVYLNSAGAGLAWAGQPAAAVQYYNEVAKLGAEAQPLWQERAEAVRGKLARLVGTPTTDVAFFRNTTEVINLAANSVDWRPGDEVVVASDDFPSVRLPWTKAEQCGGRVITVDIDDEDARTDRLISALTTTTRVVAVTHVNAVTGTRVDLDRLGTACREVGALLVVDGIEALGAIPIDLGGADVYASAMFKWMLSGWGTSIGIFRQRSRDLLTPAYRGYRNPPPDPSFEYADPNYPGLYVLDATLDYLDDLGWGRIYERVDQLTGQVADAVDRLGLTVVTPAAGRAGILSFDAGEAAEVVGHLKHRQIDVVNKLGLVRVSPHFYNTESDVDRFGQALEESLSTSRLD